MDRKSRFLSGFVIAAMVLSGVWPSSGITSHRMAKNSSFQPAYSSHIFVDNDGTLNPVRVTVAPVVDGNLDDKTWNHTPIQKTFMTYNPTYGDELPQKTDIWLAYDDKNLYFAFRCYDTEPEKVKTSITQRDHIFQDDWVGFTLDALGNKQSAYDLFVNPNGIQGDILNSAVSGEDLAPDFVWESAGQVTEYGYDVEIALPLRTIRFKSGAEVNMGILFWRRISRLGTSGSWPEVQPGQGLFNVHAKLQYENLKRPLTLEVLPSFTYGIQENKESTQGWSNRESDREFGIGLKYGLTSSMTIEGTYNPDFSQVESDAFQAEVNRRFPIYYSEKRPFFMEGLDIFDFAIITHGMMLTAVHTRQIVDPQWGAKLTGSLGKASFGVLAAQDDFPGYAWEDEQNPHEGKKATFLIGRGKVSLKGDSYLGAIYSGRTFAAGVNHVVGTDAQFRLLPNHQMTVSALQSITTNMDSNATQNGLALFTTQGYFTRKLSISAAYEHYTPDFEMASSFLMRRGIHRGWMWISPNFYPDPERMFWLRRITPELIYSHTYDLTTEMHDRFLQFAVNMNFTRQGFFRIETYWEHESWEGMTFKKRALGANGNIQLTNWLRFGGYASRRGQIYYRGDPAFLGYSYRGGFFINIQPSAKLTQTFDYDWQNFFRDSDDTFVYDLSILYSRTTYQFNKYFFMRAILQYNSLQEKLLTDFLASFTFIPGTVIHLGYGSLFTRRSWQNEQWEEGIGKLRELRRGLFFKASYLWHF